MNRKNMFVVIAMFLVASMVLSSCGAPATPTAAPATSAPATVAPVLLPTATEAPAAPPFAAKYNLSAPDCTYGGEFKSIEAVDANTVKFSLCYPDPAFLSKVALASFGIQPAAYLEKTSGGGTGSDLLIHPVGTGPYMLAQWQKGQEVDLTAFPDYWGTKALTKTVVFRWSARIGAAIAGTAGRYGGCDRQRRTAGFPHSRG